MTPFILPLKNRAEAEEKFIRFMRRLDPNKRWAIEVKEAKPTRSNEQNRYLWGVVYPTILREGDLEGWTSKDLHEYFLGEHFGWETVEGFGRRRQRPIRRSSRLSKGEFMDYIAFIQREMAGRGVYIPDPNEEMAA